MSYLYTHFIISWAFWTLVVLFSNSWHSFTFPTKNWTPGPLEMLEISRTHVIMWKWIQSEAWQMPDISMGAGKQGQHHCSRASGLLNTTRLDQNTGDLGKWMWTAGRHRKLAWIKFTEPPQNWNINIKDALIIQITEQIDIWKQAPGPLLPQNLAAVVRDKHDLYQYWKGAFILLVPLGI